LICPGLIQFTCLQDLSARCFPGNSPPYFENNQKAENWQIGKLAKTEIAGDQAYGESGFSFGMTVCISGQTSTIFKTHGTTEISHTIQP
jgi:hypothetical protein